MKKLFFLTALLCASVMGWAAAPVAGSSTEKLDGKDFVNGYDYSFSTEGTTVTISFTEKENYTGLEAWLWNYTGGGFAETKMNVTNHTASITLTNQTSGTTLDFACKFAYAGGMSVTKRFTYIVPDPGKSNPNLTLNETEVTLDATTSETFQIDPSQDGDGAISYLSNNTSVATVTDAGLVTAVNRGTTTITVSVAGTDSYYASSTTLTVTVIGINWNNIGWIGNGTGDAAYTEKYKAIASPAGMTINNLQINAEKKCLHVICPSAAFGDCSLASSNYHTEGAGLFIHLNAFSAQETQFTLVCGGTTYTFDVYYEDGGDIPAALDNTEVEAKTFKVIENGQLFIIKNGVKYNALGTEVR